MTSTLPKFRGDLELRRRATPEGAALVIKDPLNGEFFRLKEAEDFITQQLDGATPLEVIQSRMEAKFGASLAPDALAHFVETLDRNGLLETGRSPRKQRRRRGRRVGRSVLYLRFRFFDPDRLFGTLAPRVRWCFTPSFVVLSAGLILVAVALALLDWGEIVRDSSRLYGISTLPLLMVTVFSVIAAHEFAHGLTCKHFGGEVRELGFLLFYFQPALYCNVSDAWLFAEKSKRMWVGFAGPYFELVLWSLATLTWRLTDTTTWVNYVALIVMVTSGVKTLFNFNPLLKLDGYYLLSDYLDIPNLRRKSFDYVGRSLKRLLGFTSGPAPEWSRRERRLFLAYGLTASACSFSLLGYLGWKVGGFLIEQDQRVAFLAFVGVLGTRVRIKLRKLFGRGPRSSDSSKGRFAFPRRRAVFLTALAALLAALPLGRMELKVAGPIDVLPVHNADVRAQIGGIIEEIRVQEGDYVREGDVIARLWDRDYRAELAKTEAEAQQTEAKLDLLLAGPTKEQIEVARMAVMKAQGRLKFARARLERDTALFEQELLSRNDFDTTRELESTAEGELAEAESRLEVLLKGSRPEEIRAAGAELERLETQRRYLEEQLQLVTVVSPATGVVTTPTRQLKEMMRQMVQKGDLIAKVHELNTVTVEVAVPEKEIADVSTGQAVALKVRAYPNRIFHGKVTEIATTARAVALGSGSFAKAGPPGSPITGGNSANTVLVTTEIDNSARLLKPGMTGMGKIYCGERRLIDLVMRRLALTFKVEFWSWW